MDFNDRLGNFLKHEIDSINQHLPKKRIPLKLASQGYNYYINRENNQLYIDKKEIELLQSLCPKGREKDVYLPIIIIRRRDLGVGTYVISGELIEEFLVLKALNKYEQNWEEFLKNPPEKIKKFLYKPDLIKLRKVLATSTVIGFS